MTYNLPPRQGPAGGTTGKTAPMGPPVDMPASPMPEPNQLNSFDADGGGGAMFGPQPSAPRSGVSVGGVGTAIPTLGGGSMGSGVGVRGKFSFKKGGKVKKMAKGGSVSSASKRADGCATKGKTKGKFV